jgi:hypothetical protein
MKKHADYMSYKGTILWDEMDDFYQVELIVVNSKSTLEYLTNVERKSTPIPVE